jgi:hypothetical protein
LPRPRWRHPAREVAGHEPGRGAVRQILHDDVAAVRGLNIRRTKIKQPMPRARLLRSCISMGRTLPIVYSGGMGQGVPSDF